MTHDIESTNAQFNMLKEILPVHNENVTSTETEIFMNGVLSFTFADDITTIHAESQEMLTAYIDAADYIMNDYDELDM